MAKRTIFMDATGPLMVYDTDASILRIDDLSPQVAMRWRLSRRELFWIGLRFIRIALVGR
jgi:hypothetical protein